MNIKYLAITSSGDSIAPPTGIPTGGIEKLASIVVNGIDLALTGIVLLSLIFLIWGGIQWIMSGGDKAKVQAARNRITYAIIGLIFAFLSFTIIQFIGYVFNISLILNISSPFPGRGGNRF